MKIGLFLQARLNSHRVLHKVQKPLGRMVLIQEVLLQLKKVFMVIPEIQQIYLLTTANSLRSLFSFLGNDPEVIIFTGDEEEVLDRFYLANLCLKNDIIIRATADNPFVSVEHIASILRHHICHDADLSHYLGLPLGAGVEVISQRALDCAYKNASTSYQREHVTPYIYENRDSLNVQEPEVLKPYYRPDIRITIDSELDFVLGNLILERAGSRDLGEIIEIWDEEVIPRGWAIRNRSF